MLETAILGFLYDNSLHGYELKQHIAMLTGHFRPVSDGALYPAISRLEKQGLLVKKQEVGKAGAPRQVMTLTEKGRAELLQRLREPSDVDISDRNRLFTLLAFFKYLNTSEQLRILKRRLEFIEGGKSFFTSGSKPVSYAQEQDIFRKGMLLLARETSRVEKQWLQETIKYLEREC